MKANKYKILLDMKMGQEDKNLMDLLILEQKMELKMMMMM